MGQYDILELLEKEKKELETKEIAEKLNAHVANVNKDMIRLRKDNFVKFEYLNGKMRYFV